MFIVFWLAMCAIIGAWASSWNRSFIGWFIVSALFSPIIGAIALAVSGRK